MDWARILAYVTGTVDQELLARNEYLAAENRILKAQLRSAQWNVGNRRTGRVFRLRPTKLGSLHWR
jgi:hypothetical protein